MSEFHDQSRISDFELFCNHTLKIIRPHVVVASGDLTDGKRSDMAGSGQFEFEWQAYDRIIKNSDLLTHTTWLDVRGNHGMFYFIL